MSLDERWKALGSPWQYGMAYSSAPGLLDLYANYPMPADVVPLWSHPATLGALLGLVRERHGDGSLYATWAEVGSPRPRWAVYGATDTVFFSGRTEAEALIAALEAAREA